MVTRTKLFIESVMRRRLWVRYCDRVDERKEKKGAETPGFFFHQVKIFNLMPSTNAMLNTNAMLCLHMRHLITSHHTQPSTGWGFS